MKINQLKSTVDVLADYIGNFEDFSLDSRLRDSGLDSLDIAEMAMDLEEQFHIKMGDCNERAIQKMTVMEVIELVDGMLKEKEACNG